MGRGRSYFSDTHLGRLAHMLDYHAVLNDWRGELL
jgi:hypothetical protein